MVLAYAHACTVSICLARCSHFLGLRLGSVTLTVTQHRSLRHHVILRVTIKTTKQLQIEKCKNKWTLIVFK